MLHSHLFKSVQKDMLKAWKFTKSKLDYRYFVNIVQKLFKTNILENALTE